MSARWAVRLARVPRDELLSLLGTAVAHYAGELAINARDVAGVIERLPLLELDEAADWAATLCGVVDAARVGRNRSALDEVYQMFEARCAVYDPLPSAADRILLSSDLLPGLILAPLSMRDCAAACVCSVWRDAWTAGRSRNATSRVHISA